jgi:hypothetical protein
MQDPPEPQKNASTTRSREVLSRFGRLCWNTAGTFFLALGLIGIPLPFLPTTPFLLVAAACYLRGSLRMYNWMMTNRYFGAYLKDYLEGRGLSIRAKLASVSMLWIVIALSAVLATGSDIVRVCLIAVAVGVTVHVFLLRTRS